MKSWFSDAYLARLNAHYNGGVLLRAAVLSIDDMTTGYYVDAHDPVTFNGNEYIPIPMRWQGIGQNSQRDLPRVSVTVSNVDGQVGAFLETTSLLGRDVTIQLLHADLLATVTDVDSIRLQILLVEWTDMQATFTAGLNLALTEQIPRRVVTRAEFPGTPDDLRRASIL